jgi:hypothetical protein
MGLVTSCSSLTGEPRDPSNYGNVTDNPSNGTYQNQKSSLALRGYSLTCFNDQTSMEASKIRFWQSLKDSTESEIAILAYFELFPMYKDHRGGQKFEGEYIAKISPEEFEALLRKESSTLLFTNYKSRKVRAGTTRGIMVSMDDGSRHVSSAVSGDVYWFGCR